MEDPAESECREIQEYYSYSKEGDDNDLASMVKWILNKGCVIGKEIVITGIVVLSAPIVVPPIVVFSAMGVAFSVPFGVVFATYASTTKIMSMLLPIPPSPSPLMLAYYTDEYEQGKHEGTNWRSELDDGGFDEYDDNDDDREVDDFVTNADVDEERHYIDEEEKEDGDDEFGPENLVEDEDNEQMEDLNQGGDMVFELDEGGGDYGKEGEASVMNVDENVDEESNHANENVDEKEMKDHVVPRESVIIQGVETRLGLDVVSEDQGYEEDSGECLEGDDDSFEDERKGEEPLIESQVDGNTSNAQKAKMEGGTGFSRDTNDEDNLDNMVEDDYLLDENATIFEDLRDVETTEPVMVKEIDSKKLLKDGNQNDETVGEMCRIVILAEENHKNSFNLREVKDLDLVAREVNGDTNNKARNTEPGEKSTGTQEETGGYTANDGSEDTVMKTKKEHLIHLNADVTELSDERSLDLFDERNTNINVASLEVGNEPKENSAVETVDVLALPAVIKQTPLATDNGKDASKTKNGPKIPSREDVLDNDKIWEKIEAMRTIVGYKAASQPTFTGELTALYVFTGVEPPASFKDDSDLDEVNSKLKFLMSIVGVK